MKTIRKNKIKALFIDECDILSDSWKEMIKSIKKHVNVIWISTNGYGHSLILSGEDNLSVFSDLMKFKLDVNLRNCASIVKEAFRLEERQCSDYKEGLVLPPANFPNGIKPTHFTSLEDAVTEMRKVTNDGVLVIALLEHKDNQTVLNKMNLKWKRYVCHNENDFKEGESPYQYLVDGNILYIDNHRFINGFEWQNIITTGYGTGTYDHHLCNWYMRCTTNLMIVQWGNPLAIS